MRIGSEKLDAVSNSEVGWAESDEAGIDGRNGVFLPLLFVIDEEPRSVGQDWPTDTPPNCCNVSTGRANPFALLTASLAPVPELRL